MIKLFCKGLPYKISKQLYSEFDIRKKDAYYLMKNIEKYKTLRPDSDLVELIIAMSIFYKRVISNLESFSTFSDNIFLLNKECKVINIGKYFHSKTNNSELKNIIKPFYAICSKYDICVSMFDYLETKELLRGIISKRQSK